MAFSSVRNGAFTDQANGINAKDMGTASLLRSLAVFFRA
jgi:hypothetical protein